MSEPVGSAICLDTNTCSAFFKSDARAVPVLGSADRLILPVIVLGELRAGFLGGTRAAANELGLRKMLALPHVSVATITETTTDLYADLQHALKRRGTPVPTNDIWIAACAVEHDAPLFTFDKHFAQIKAAHPAFRWMA